MRVNLDLSSIKSNDTVIVANNRQALALKKSLAQSDRASRLSNVYSYQSFLEKLWKNSQINQERRLLTQLEFLFLLLQFRRSISKKS